MLQTKRKVKRKVKYVIIASIGGVIYGSFKPTEDERAKIYLAQLRTKEPTTQINIHYVSNLNQFLSSIKFSKRKRVTLPIKPQETPQESVDNFSKSL